MSTHELSANCNEGGHNKQKCQLLHFQLQSSQCDAKYFDLVTNLIEHEHISRYQALL
jgi:hypothetical protein